jgi:predicted GNAT family acetyltransferase
VFQVKNNESSSRFEAQVNGYTAILTYRRLGKSIVLDHTEVPPAVEGRGIASKLARTAPGIRAR